MSSARKTDVLVAHKAHRLAKKLLAANSNSTNDALVSEDKTRDIRQIILLGRRQETNHGDDPTTRTSFNDLLDSPRTSILQMYWRYAIEIPTERVKPIRLEAVEIAQVEVDNDSVANLRRQIQAHYMYDTCSIRTRNEIVLHRKWILSMCLHSGRRYVLELDWSGLLLDQENEK